MESVHACTYLGNADASLVQAGDAIYIPEGWWHQIDSVAGTIAVNIWWRSAFDRQLGGHMDAYYLRRALQSLTETHKAQLLKEPISRAAAAQEHAESGAAGLARGDKASARPVKRQRSVQDKKPTYAGGPEAISGIKGCDCQRCCFAQCAACCTCD